MHKKLLIFSWSVASLLLLVYSFTQIDLSLTFSRVSIWQYIQKIMQYIGYYMRPFSTYSVIAIILLMMGLYVWTLIKAAKGDLDNKTFWKIFIPVSIILFFSYNAFSYDFFNYIFDAKLVTYYHVDPHQFRALDFYRDPMLSFMHSTHRTYPYGPTWIWLTVPFSFLGANYFLGTFYLFKLLIVGSFVGSVYFLEKILILIKSKKVLFGTALFALNPLVLVESAVSAHNDIVMVFLGLGSLYFLLKKKWILSIVFLILSMGIKYATILLVPFFLYVIFKNLKKSEVNLSVLFNLIFFVMLLAVAVVSLASGQNKNPEFQPWYLLIMLPFASFLAPRTLVAFLVAFISLGALASYIPYLYNGEWPKNIVDLKLILLGISFVFGLVFYFTQKLIPSKS